MRIALLTTDSREHYGDYAHPRPYFGTAPEALLQGFAALSEIEVHVVSCVQQPVPSPEKIAPNIFYHSIVVPKAGWMRTLYSGCIRAVRRKLREIQPDIVHGQGTERDCALTAVFSGYPNVLTIHGNMQAIAQFYHARFPSFHWLAAKLEVAALKRTAGVLCNSAYTERLVAPHAKKSWRVANGLRLDFFETPRLARPVGPPVLLNIGSTLAYKQQLEILKVAEALWRRGLKFELHFAGDRALPTAYGAAFARQLAGAERAGYARHLGMLDAGQLIAALDAASALIHFPTEEAFGLVVAEALARNLKLFAATTGGVVDIASGVEGAELFAASDFPVLEKALAHWFAHGCPTPRTAATVMQQRYHPQAVAQRHREIYREVLFGSFQLCR